MAEIGIWRSSRAAANLTGLPAARRGRWTVQLWACLHAQQLLHGLADVAAATEDDRRRIRTGCG